jgi:hypothetical protein
MNQHKGGNITSRQDWRNPEEYRYIRELDQSGLAWEFLRRNSAYAKKVAHRNLAQQTTGASQELDALTEPGTETAIVEGDALAAEWGLAFAEAPNLNALQARLFWMPDSYKATPTVQAAAAQQTREAFKIRELGRMATLLLHPDGYQLLLLSDGARRIQLAISQGNLRQGDCHLHFSVSGGPHTEDQLATITGFLFICRHRRFPRPPRGRKRSGQRSAMQLQAHDGRNAGATFQQIAVALWGDWVRQAWKGPGHDALRMRVKRLLATGNRMVQGGYRDLLR